MNKTILKRRITAQFNSEALGLIRTSPVPAFRTALINDMMAVFRFTSSRYLPMLRSSSLSNDYKEKIVRK